MGSGDLQRKMEELKL